MDLLKKNCGLSKHNIFRSFAACLIVLVFMMVTFRKYLLDSQSHYSSQYEITRFHNTPDFTEKVESTESIARRDLLQYYHENVFKADAPRRKRFPDFIGIGVEKCGTGALRHMLLHHPMIKSSQPAETHFFTNRRNYTNGLRYYKSLMPEVAEYELVTEKTPAYFDAYRPGTPHLSQIIKNVLPEAKIIAVICDPVNRTFSDFIQEIRMGTISSNSIYEVIIYELLNLIMGKVQRLAGHESDIIDYINELKLDRPRSHILTTGLYYYHIKKWLEIFGRDEFLIVDGKKLITDPASIIEKVQEFLHLPKFIIREDFVKDPETGFFCISPVNVINTNGNYTKVVKQKEKCLKPSIKGRTRNGAWSYTPDKTVLNLVRNFYKEPNRKLFQLLGRKFDWQ